MRKKEEFYDIRQVIELTGVSEFTLRGWESRYNAVKPARGETGRRMYSRKDILKIQTLTNLVNRGYRISSVASLSLEELQPLLEDREEIFAKTATLLTKPTKVDSAIRQILKLSDRFDWDQITKIFIKKRTTLPPRDFILNFILPLIQELNHQIDRGQFSITQEHIFSSFIKENLFYIKSTLTKTPRKDIRLVLATPEGDMHEIGLLIASTLASLHGVSALYLGPNTPKNEVCDACLRFKATHLLISSTVSRDDGSKEELLSFINFLDRHLAPDVTLWLGGRLGLTTTFSLKRDFYSFRSLEELDLHLKK